VLQRPANFGNGTRERNRFRLNHDLALGIYRVA
jgi:hypothetical protein